MSRKCKFCLNLTRITVMKACVHLWYILPNFSQNEKCFRRKLLRKWKHTFLCSVTFLWKSSRLLDNGEKFGTATQATDDIIIRHVRFACWMTKVTDTHSEYSILLAFPWPQCLCKHSSMLRYMYITCLGVLEFYSWGFSHNTLWLWPCVHCCSSA